MIKTANTLCNGIIQLMCKFRSLVSPKATVRTDPATSMQSLVNDKELKSHDIEIELGHPKYVNKNAIAEKAIEELHAELVKQQPAGGKISDVTLAKAIAALNSRIRYNNLSSSEIWNLGGRGAPWGCN